MVDLTKKPFNLSPEDIAWVDETLASLKPSEKINQIFIDMIWNEEPDKLAVEIKQHNYGGYRYNNQKPLAIYEQNKVIQSGKVPALIAANVEMGGDGAMSGGTRIGDGIAVAATQDPKNAYYLGYYGCKEAAAVGCNWTFAPVADVDLNWRNCIISNRAFGSDSNVVLDMSLEYFRGASDAGVACCVKHFPGDGCDERDQHLATTVNDLSCEEWDDTFGKIYKGLIDAGMQSIMIGHIMQPEYSRALRPGIKDEEIMPATLAPEILQDLLREKLEFNGMIITDATHMLGLTSKKKRCDFLPEMIMSGCDMILYYRDRDEDINYMKDALRSKKLTMKRLNEAVRTVLGFKAMLGLHKKQKQNKLMPPKSAMKVIGCPEHKAKEREILDKSITLVKNTRNQLPLTPETHKNIVIYSVESGGISKLLHKQKSIAQKLEAALKAEGFNPTIFKINPLKYMTPKGLNGKKALNDINIKHFTETYDAAMLIMNVTDFSTSNGRSLRWKIPMGPEIPWYVGEVPTVAISVAHPFHLLDIPMVPTYINTYNASDQALKQTVEKIMGKSEFKGVSPVDAFCGMWDTKL
ncbi:MAG: glycosyl hydrolase family 3 [Epulopiscium sp. Nele67-Bin004]|nr:MAG: glycosyl hydrolase family 3 [Epulopiscium sp. Nele67-Bin004]